MFGRRERENRQIQLLFEIKQKITAEAKEEDITQFNNTIIKCVIRRRKKPIGLRFNRARKISEKKIYVIQQAKE